MKNFQFRLDRVLDWRRTEMEMEETRLKQLRAAQTAIEREKDALESARENAGRTLLQQPSVYGAELQLLAGYNTAVKLLSARLDEKRRANEQAAVAQQQKLLEARRRLRLLENLKDRRLAEWRYETDRQLDADLPPRTKRPLPCLS